MRKYEIMVIVSPDVDERQVTPMMEKYLETVTKAGGTVENLDLWGKRRMAYEIKKRAEGIYVVINLTAEPGDIKEMDRLMTIDERILRTKVLRPELH